jgi:hypothetical protein
MVTKKNTPRDAPRDRAVNISSSLSKKVKKFSEDLVGAVPHHDRCFLQTAILLRSSATCNQQLLLMWARAQELQQIIMNRI